MTFWNVNKRKSLKINEIKKFMKGSQKLKQIPEPSQMSKSIDLVKNSPIQSPKSRKIDIVEQSENPSGFNIKVNKSNKVIIVETEKQRY